MGPTPQGLPASEGLPYAHGRPVSQCHPAGVPHAWTWSYVNPHLHLFLFLRDWAAPPALPHCHLGVDQMPQRVPKTQTYGVIPGPHGWARVQAGSLASELLPLDSKIFLSRGHMHLGQHVLT